MYSKLKIIINHRLSHDCSCIAHMDFITASTIFVKSLNPITISYKL